MVVLNAADKFGLQRLGIAGDAKGAVIHVTPSAASDLAHLFRAQGACGVAVELLQRREGDMVDIHIDAHADSIGRHQEVHFAGLIKLHLGVAGARG